jgi:hypothetical protein
MQFGKVLAAGRRSLTRAVLVTQAIGLGVAGFGSEAFATPAQGCAYDRPCVTSVYETKAGAVTVEWNGQDNYNVYNVRWSRPGKDEVQVESGGGSSGSFHVKNARSRTTYRFAIQGCNKRPLQSSKCTPWENAQLKTK